VNPVGLIVSSFRPSDDATTFSFLVPSNLFAVTSLKQIAEIAQEVVKDAALAAESTALAKEVNYAIQQYAIVEHPKYGKVYAFEVDGFGNAYFMDDANVPSLLAMPYLDIIDRHDPVYRNTRKLVLSEDNPYFFKGTAGEGIGGPHIGYDMIWPMSIIMRAQTSTSDEEIKCVFACCVIPMPIPDSCMSRFTKTILQNSPENGSRGSIPCLANSLLSWKQKGK